MSRAIIEERARMVAQFNDFRRRYTAEAAAAGKRNPPSEAKNHWFDGPFWPAIEARAKQRSEAAFAAIHREFHPERRDAA